MESDESLVSGHEDTVPGLKIEDKTPKGRLTKAWWFACGISTALDELYEYACWYPEDSAEHNVLCAAAAQIVTALDRIGLDMLFYVLDLHGDPKPCTNPIEWAKQKAKWFDTRWRVARDDAPFGAFVSTVFLGIDHRFLGDGPPILWETRVFGGPHDGLLRHYTRPDTARAGHREVLAMVRAEGGIDGE